MGTQLFHDRMHPLHGARSPRDHRKFSGESLEVQLAHDRVMPLLHEEHARAWLELFLDQLELALGEPESLDILRGVRIRVWKENLRRRLLDDRARDGAPEPVARPLRCRATNPVPLAPDLK